MICLIVNNFFLNQVIWKQLNFDQRYKDELKYVSATFSCEEFIIALHRIKEEEKKEKWG